ncbi:hypothetical protein [uncultured Rhodoblastus sp.]|uniref:hypothetical protein n=1 Tax=uncultured Rhodoblastus sp. TaxID=543037 RepID=UPI0025CDE225|nr:hypothetical protein [uncultured Rhodoblastus sp.]
MLRFVFAFMAMLVVVATPILSSLAALGATAAAPDPLVSIKSIFASLATPAAIAYSVTIAAALLPKATGPGVWAFVRGVIDLIGANFGNAKNAL